MPRRARQEALRSALFSKFRDQQVFLIDELHFDKPSTKAVAGYLKSLGISGTCLLVPKEHSEALHLSVRNLHGCRVVPYKDLNAYEVLRYRNLLLSEAALKSLLESMAHA
jgi:large subunit ribosomal protein L4